MLHRIIKKFVKFKKIKKVTYVCLKQQNVSYLLLNQRGCPNHISEVTSLNSCNKALKERERERESMSIRDFVNPP